MEPAEHSLIRETFHYPRMSALSQNRFISHLGGWKFQSSVRLQGLWDPFQILSRQREKTTSR